MSLPRAAALLLLLASTSVLAAGGTAVAVLPFRDLSGSASPVGDAIRESVTSDLRNVPGLRVVERAEIDRVIGEQRLQAKHIDDDPLATVRVGKLLGADLVTVGAYQKVGRHIRITARFVRVETGEVVGTAKVDGSELEFLTLQDRVTVELLKSARIAHPVVERFARRSRPRLRSFKTVELYGRASKEPDVKKKRRLLQQAVQADPGFSYALEDLAALEKRLQAYDEQAEANAQAQLERMRTQLEAAKTPAERMPLLNNVLGTWMGQRRYFTVLSESERWSRKLGRGGGDPPDLMTAAYYHVYALELLNQHDAVLREGDRFLTRWKDSPWFGQVKGWLELELRRRKEAQAGKAAAAEAVSALPTTQKWNLCRVAWVYRMNHQLPEAERLLRACLEVGPRDRAAALGQLVDVEVELGDWKRAQGYLEMLKKEAPDTARSLAERLPVDG